MKVRIRLDRSTARSLMLAAQGLDRRPRQRARPADLLAAIRGMGALQIDSIHVVARSPYLVLWSRLGAYPPEWLDELLEQNRIFEYWAHEACFLPIEDYPIHRFRMGDSDALGWKYRAEWVSENGRLIEEVFAEVRRRGPVRAADFDSPKRHGAWWGWKPAKRALEMLFSEGRLMIARRHRFQRVYDLRERVHPRWDERPALPADEAVRELALRAIAALGVARADWVADYFRTSRRETVRAVQDLVDSGRLMSARVEGWKEPGWIHPDNAQLADAAAAGEVRPTLTTLLSPFDPLVWDRSRALEVFGFDYRLECYTPARKRRFGYFCLPILRRGRLIGRLDAKAHRSSAVLDVRSLHLEQGVRESRALAADVGRALRQFADWQDLDQVRLRRVVPRSFRRVLAAAVD